LDDDPFLDGHAGDDVLLQDALEAPRGDVVIPDPFGIDDEPRTVCANAEAGCLCAHDFYFRFFHALFDEFPQLLAVAGLAAVGSEADEQMFVRAFHSGFAQTFLEIFFAHLFSLNCRSLQITEKTRSGSQSRNPSPQPSPDGRGGSFSPGEKARMRVFSCKLRWQFHF